MERLHRNATAEGGPWHFRPEKKTWSEDEDGVIRAA